MEENDEKKVEKERDKIMIIGEIFSVICYCILLFPYDISNKIIQTKHLIAQQFQLSLFIIINRNKYHSLIGQ